MIEVIEQRNSNGTIKGFQMSGHANSGPHGQDLVCAAASAVSFGTVNAIISMCECEPYIEQSEDGGFLKVSLPEQLSGERLNKAQTLLEGMFVSLETIERDYGQYINISKP
ncbi:ribosomal-processing cysteine protease Prp [Alkalibacillus haloalkaliphilus]|uniref:ribosomal-processing cysteine protease Prp n=1 Tax=Alkalibacillus haloalkaliphilus TaxID=94136 RepID=UPI00031246A2|nr:ribosomal-processing cysteine protease Prp [Alkalibacillus haloalkaliphilus]